MEATGESDGRAGERSEAEGHHERQAKSSMRYTVQ